MKTNKSTSSAKGGKSAKATPGVKNQPSAKATRAQQSKPPSTTSPQDQATPPAIHTPGEIALRAYQHFQNRGSAEGNHTDDWLRAEAELTHERRLLRS